MKLIAIIIKKDKSHMELSKNFILTKITNCLISMQTNETKSSFVPKNQLYGRSKRGFENGRVEMDGYLMLMCIVLHVERNKIQF